MCPGTGPGPVERDSSQTRRQAAASTHCRHKFLLDAVASAEPTFNHMHLQSIESHCMVAAARGLHTVPCVTSSHARGYKRRSADQREQYRSKQELT